MPFSLQKALDDYLSQEAPYDRTKSFHVSGMGLCLRKRILQRLNKPCAETPERVKRIFLSGKTNHILLQDVLATGNYLLEKEIPCEWKEYELRGRADALVQTDEGLLLLEFKNTHSRKLLYNEVDRHYIMQGLTYLKLLNPQYNNAISQLRICLISRDDWLIKETGHYLTPEFNEAIETEVKNLWGYWQRKELPDELPEGSWECFAGKTYVCPYIENCPKAGARKEKKRCTPPREKK